MDRIVAVVDDEVVLQSEVQEQYNYLLQAGQRDDGTLFCRVMENLLVEKLLLARARIDSLTVSDDQVNSELNRRIELMVRRVGSAEALETQLGQTLAQLKLEQRPMVREQLLTEQMRSKIFSGITVTPSEVREFFNQIPRDSLPLLPAEVEISQIIIKPTPSDSNKAAARRRLAGILADIKAGTITFAEAARRYSQDRGSAEQSGSLGELSRSDVVPEFAEAVFNLQPNQISDVFESPFGYHIALLHGRTGDKVRVSHILIKPVIDGADEARARQRLAALRARIVAGEITFEAAARDNSDDRRTRDGGGMLTDPVSDSYRIPLDQLDADMYLKIDGMRPGDISQPLDMLYQDVELVRAFQLVWLRKRIPPHRASLETDYEKFYNAAKQAKQAEHLENWLKRTRRQIYVQIKENSCQQELTEWLQP
jgi:peptidyl-prolyl cis-trans isomerase SurA